MDRDFVFELYRDSWHRRNQLASEVAFPLGALTLLWGALILLLKLTLTYHERILAGVSIVLLFGAFVTFSKAVWYLLRVYHGYEYATIPMVTDMLAHKAYIDDTYAELDDREALARQAFDEYVVSVLANAADWNAESNEVRTARLHEMRKSIVSTTVLTSAATIPWFLTQAAR